MPAVATVLAAQAMAATAVVAPAATAVPSPTRPAARRAALPGAAPAAGTSRGMGEVFARDREAKAGRAEGQKAGGDGGRKDATIHGRWVSRNQYQ